MSKTNKYNPYIKHWSTILTAINTIYAVMMLRLVKDKTPICKAAELNMRIIITTLLMNKLSSISLGILLVEVLLV